VRRGGKWLGFDLHQQIRQGGGRCTWAGAETGAPVGKRWVLPVGQGAGSGGDRHSGAVGVTSLSRAALK
jgi:hypothetical protein